MAETITIRVAEPADAEAVRAIGLETWPPTYEPIAGAEYVEYYLSTYWSQEFIQRIVDAGDVLVAESGTEVVGMATLGEKDGVPVMWKLYVQPGHQGSGAGSALLQGIVERAAAQSDRLRLDVIDGNDRAHGFYRAKGFREIGREPEARPEWPDTIWMELEL